MDNFVLTTSNQDLNLAREYAQKDAQDMIDYFKINKMAIQTDKTALMMIKPNRVTVDPIKIKIDEELISQKGSFKMLGVVFDDDLNCEEHMTKLIKKTR